MILRALAAMFAMGAKKVMAERAVLGGQIVVHWILVSSYGVFFRSVSPDALQKFGLTPQQLIWYFAITQTVITCTFYHWRDLEQDIRTGRLEVMLLRPVDFWPLAMAEWVGQYVMRVILIAPLGLLAAWFISGGFPGRGGMPDLMIFPCLWLGGIIFICLHFLVGCTALWTSPTEPVYRIWQKLSFLIGARSSPILLYPVWSQAFVWLTPFPAMLAVEGNLVLGHADRTIALQIAIQLGWIVAGLCAVAYTARLVRQKTLRDG